MSCASLCAFGPDPDVDLRKKDAELAQHLALGTRVKRSLVNQTDHGETNRSWIKATDWKLEAQHLVLLEGVFCVSPMQGAYVVDQAMPTWPKKALEDLPGRYVGTCRSPVLGLASDVS